jgi:hypothetical protein
MVASRTCKAHTEKGEPCRAAPMVKSDFCVFHDPQHAEVVQQARSAGGQRKRKEVAVSIAYDFQGLDSIPSIRRLVEVAAYDALGLPNDLGRVRALGYLAQVSVTLLEKGEIEERVTALEALQGLDRKKDRR